MEVRLAPETAQTSVGALGWLGFTIVNIAVWGIVTTASMINWGFGFALCLVYTGIIWRIAVTLESRPNGKERYNRFLNLLWLVVCTFVFILGMFIAVEVVGKWWQPSESARPDSAEAPNLDASGLPDVLPGDASEELKGWAESASNASSVQSFARFADNVYMLGKAKDNGHADALLRVDGALGVSPVVSAGNGTLHRVQDITEFQSSLFFFAEDAADAMSDRGLWRLGSDAPGSAVRVVTKADLVGSTLATLEAPLVSTGEDAASLLEVGTGDDVVYPRLLSIFRDEASDSLYFSSYYYCRGVSAAFSGCWAHVYSIYRSDGTAAGTVDLRGDVCSAACATGAEGTFLGFEAENRMELWGVLILAVFPMMGVAFYVMHSKEVASPIVSLWLGGQLIGLLLYELVGGNSLAETVELLTHAGFLTWFITVYNVVWYVALGVWSLNVWTLPEWQEEMKTWAVFVVGWTSLVMIHIVLQVPFTTNPWAWNAYTMLTLVQLLLGVMVSRPVPMIAGCFCLFIMSWKVATEFVHVTSFEGEESRFLVLLALMVLEGTIIVMTAMALANKLAIASPC